MGKKPSYAVQIRRRLVRQLLVEGLPDGQIVKLLVQGTRPHKGGEIIKVSEATARRDLEAVGQEFSDLFGDENMITREIGAAFERYKLIGSRAMAAGRYSAAVQATDRVLKIAATASTQDRFRRLVERRRADIPGTGAGADGLGDGEMSAALAELEALELGELEQVHRQKLARLESMGIKVLDGGKGGDREAG